jgi:hypothetical protein
LILRNTEEFFASDADLHLDSSTYLPIDSSILYHGYVSDQPDSSSVTGGFYSNWFDGTIKLANETWHIEPTRKYGLRLSDRGPSIIYNALDVDVTAYDNHQAFRSKRFVMNEGESSFCGLDKDGKRQKMQEETDRLQPSHDNDDERIESAKSDFKSRYTSRSKRQTDERERTCCYIYIRVDPTLWDVVYKNEGLNVRHALLILSFRSTLLPIGKGTNHSRHCHISLSDCHRGQCDLSNVEVRIQRRCSLSIYSTHQTHSRRSSHIREGTTDRIRFPL